MTQIIERSVHASVLLLFLALLAACSKAPPPTPVDHPRLTSDVVLRDVTFRSAALNRDMQYRVVMPVAIRKGRILPVIYLLHGGGGTYRDWTNYSEVARYAERGLLLIMPEGDDSYYTNSASRPQDRYADYIVHDLLTDVESRFPAGTDRAHRAIAGVSMGGYGAIKLAMHYPELFFFAGGLSSAIDVPSRPFSIRRIQQYRYHESIFGPWRSQSRRDNDPFVLARSADPRQVPFLYFTCGDKEGLLPSNRSFAKLLSERNFNFEFHEVAGGHDWNQWNAQVPGLFLALSKTWGLSGR